MKINDVAEAPRSSNIRGYYKGYPIQITLRDPEEKVFPLLKKMIKVATWMEENDFKPSWNEDTNRQMQMTKEELGVCGKCGAPNLLSKQGNKYCSKKCWLL